MKAGLATRIALLCLVASAAFGAEPVDEAQVLRFLRENPDFLNRHPELVEAARRASDQARRIHARTRVLEAQQAHAALLSNPLLPRLGAAAPDVRIVEFMDYRCPPCRASWPAIEDLLAKDPGVSVLTLPYPLFGDESTYATRVAYAAHRQGKFHGMHRWLQIAPVIDRRSVLQQVQAMQLDKEQFLRDVNDERLTGLMRETVDMARMLGIEGAPAFLVGDLLLVGGVDHTSLRRAVAMARCVKQQSGGAPATSQCAGK